MKISILNENTVYKRGLIAEHGLSLLIETDNKRILFDMGQSFAFTYNAEKMNISLEGLDAIVISHGHYDHTGGLEYLVKSNQKLPNIYVQEEAFFEKKNGEKNIGIPWNVEEFRDNIVYVSEKEEIFQNIYLISNIPYYTDFERVPSKFKKIKYGKIVEDDMIDEQVLVIEKEEGLFVFAGCSHRGIINILKHVNKIFNGKRICFLIAGMHLISSNNEYIQRTIDELKKIDIDKIIPLHCTGPIAISRIQAEFKDKCEMVETGQIISL